MISAPDRQRAVTLIDEARAAGARLKPACGILQISARTYQRWTTDGDSAGRWPTGSRETAPGSRAQSRGTRRRDRRV